MGDFESGMGVFAFQRGVSQRSVLPLIVTGKYLTSLCFSTDHDDIRPRICVGQQFALTEFGYTILRIVQAFGGIESRDPEPWMEKLSLTTTSANGAKVAFTE